MSDFGIRDPGRVGARWADTLEAMKPASSTGPFRAQPQVGRDTVTVEARAKFEKFWSANIESLQAFVPRGSVDAFKARAEQAFREVVDATFAKAPRGEGGSIARADAYATLAKANGAAREKLEGLGKGLASTKAWMDQVDAAGEFIDHRGAVKANTVPVSTLQQARNELQHYLEARINEMERQIPDTPSNRRGPLLHFREAAGRLIESAGREFDKRCAGAQQKSNWTESVFTKDFREAVRSSHIDALTSLMDLRERFVPKDSQPQAITLKDGQVALMRKAPALENLVLAGGGAKGVGNPPALIELAKTGALRGLNQVVGTSAGALTAACLASGVSPEGIKAFTDKTPMGAFAAKVEGIDKLYPEVTTQNAERSWKVGLAASVGGLWLGQTAKDNPADGALQFLDQLTAGGVRDYFKEHPRAIEQALRDKTIDADEAKRLGVLAAPDFDSPRTDKMVTFHDLAILHRLDSHQFKELTLTGWNKTDKSMQYFKDGPAFGNMPVALAGRISMSIPVFFQSVTYGGKEYVDGGVGSNVPTEAVTAGKTGRALEETMARSMVMVFKAGNAAHAALYEPVPANPAAPTRSDKEIQKLTGADYAATKAEDNRKTREAGPNAFVVFHGNIDTFDLNASGWQKQVAEQASTMQALAQIEARQDQAYQVTVKSMDKAVELLSDDDVMAVCKRGEPKASSYPDKAQLDDAKALLKACLAKVNTLAFIALARDLEGSETYRQVRTERGIDFASAGNVAFGPSTDAAGRPTIATPGGR